MKTTEYKRNSVKLFGLLWLFFAPALLVASPEEAEQAEEKARAKLIEHFTTFVQDKNVMGRATTPDGKPSTPGPNKTQFNKDDGASYKSDLTYHDFSFTSDDDAFNKKQQQQQQQGNNNNQSKSRSLLPFTSSHGGLSEAGGSSALERKMYELHDKFSKQDEQDKDKRKKEDEEKGIKYRSAFKVDTKEVSKDALPKPSSSPNPNDKEKEPDKVERVTLREEARPEVEKIGEDSFGTIERAARDAGFEDDASTLGNSLFLREAAFRATESWWASTLSDWLQRVANKAIDAEVKLSEETPDCPTWAKKEIEQRTKAFQKAGGNADPQLIAQLQKEIEEAQKQCEQLTKLSYTTVNPRFEPTEDGKGTELKTGDLVTEDPYVRDLRNQLGVLKSAGKDITKLESNWKYEAEEEKQKIPIGFDENGEPSEIADWTVRDQFFDYNGQLDGAIEGFKGVKQRFPQLEINEDDINQFKIQPESMSAMEVNSLTPQQKEDLGVKVDPEQGLAISVPENYEELVEKSKGPASR